MISASSVSPGRILVIEDEVDLLDGTVTYLNMDGLTADGVSTLTAASQWMRTHQFDIVVLDLGLPDGDGLLWLEQQSLQGKGVIITTARGDNKHRLKGAQAGADIYLVKPIQLEELTTLVRNLLRRVQNHRPLKWQLNRTRWTLSSPSGQSIKLTHSESVLLQKVADKPGVAVSRQDLAQCLGHDPDHYDYRRIEILVRRLRNKATELLGKELPLETVHKLGYAFTAPIDLS
jgi:two-component system OmpR family response regulator